MEKQVAVIVSSNVRCLPECLRRAITHEFSWLDVECAPSVKSLCVPSKLSVPLILIDDSQFDDLKTHHARLRIFNPHATLALLRHAGYGPGNGPAVVQSSLVRGVLPMDLKLDVWLAAFRVLLLGGEYFPLSLQQPAAAADVPDDGPAMPAEGTSPVHAIARTAQRTSGSGAQQIQTLTHREFQILALVSLGLQNKLIAARLLLSEHTVKIHLHNIISKLGVHNRTEAASVFLDGRGSSSNLHPVDHTPPGEPVIAP